MDEKKRMISGNKIHINLQGESPTFLVGILIILRSYELCSGQKLVWEFKGNQKTACKPYDDITSTENPNRVTSARRWKEGYGGFCKLELGAWGANAS